MVTEKMKTQISDETVKRAATEYLNHKGENPYRVTRRGAELWEDHAPALRAALEVSLPSSEIGGIRCEGCGSTWTDEKLASEKSRDPRILSCGPERKLEPVWYQNIKGVLRGISLTDEMKTACLIQFEEFYKSALSAQVQDLAVDAADIGKCLLKLSTENPIKWAEAEKNPILRGWFVGQVMKHFDGKPDEQLVRELVDTVFAVYPAAPAAKPEEKP